MKPSRFIAYSERRIGRTLTVAETDAVNCAREECATGQADTIKAMRAALERSRAAAL